MRRSLIHLFGLLLMLFALHVSAFSQCLVPARTHNPISGSFNPDSALIDTCNGRELYAKLSYRVQFDGMTPFLPDAEPDSLGFFDLSDLDTGHGSYDTWLAIDTRYNGVRLARRFADEQDTALPSHWSYALSLGAYANVDSLCASLSQLDEVADVGYMYRFGSSLGLPNESGLRIVATLAAAAAPALAPEAWRHARYLEWGHQPYIYELNLPMAWEITKGKSTVVGGNDDNKLKENYAGADQPHIDMTLSTSPQGGNYLASGPFQGTGKRTKLYDDEHAYANYIIMAGQESGEGFIGIAPKIRVFGTQKGNPYTIHDVSPDAGLQLPHFMVCPYDDGMYNDSDPFITSMKSGIVVIGGHGNRIRERDIFETNPGTHNEVVYPGTPQQTTVVVEEWLASPQKVSPGSNVYTDPEDPDNPAKDVRILCVKGYDLGSQTDLEHCEAGLRGRVQFRVNTNFSEGISKFSTLANKVDRKDEKSKAAIDVVVPYPPALARYESGSKYVEYGLGSTESGNSHAAPQVAGIVGLMMSVHDRLGKAGLDVQRTVYDIITFTADKIEDPGHDVTVAQGKDYANHPSASLLTFSGASWARVYYPPNDYTVLKTPELLNSAKTKLNTSYRAMPNDPLNRHWGIRVGFGRVNAFRCLAHSIPSKNAAGEVNVKYHYSGADALDWSRGHLLEGTTFLHLGKFKNATEMVLDKGGNVYAGEPAHLNNNGKTLVDVDLSVGANQAIVIDGILTTGLTSNFKKISTTAATARILVTGWIENVTLAGQVRASDVRISRSSTGDAIRTTNNSELYGTTSVSGSGDFVVESGTLTMQPGSVLYLDGTSKLVIKPGAELRMAHGAKIVDRRTTKVANCVRLEAKTSSLAGGKLTVMPGAEGVEIDAQVQVNDDATFSVGGVNATTAAELAIPGVTLRKVTVEEGGNILVSNKAHIRKVTSAPAPVLLLKTADGLTIGAGATVRLDAPIEVGSGSKIQVESTALAQLGAITVQSNGSLIVKAGGTLQFLDQENFVRGKLVGEGEANNKARFIATNEASNCTSQPARVTYARLIVEPDVWIYNTPTPGTAALDQVLKSYVHLQNAELTNVYSTIKNMPVLARVGGVLQAGRMKQCTFKADRRVYVTAGMEAAFRDKKFYLVSISRDSRLFQKARQASGNVPGATYQQGLGLIRSLTIDGCAFHDAGGKITSTNYRGLEQKKIESLGGDYPVSGLKAESLSNITMTGCTFAFLHTGVNAENVRGKFSGNVFGGHADGIVCGSSTICNNKFSGCVQGVRATQGGNQVFDNTFGGTMTSTTNSLFGIGVQVDFIGSGYLQSLGGNAECRNNELENYGTGLHAVSGILQARDRFAFLAPNQNDRGKALVNGRNEFRGPVAVGENPYFTLNERSDVFLGGTGRALLECGKNVFSATQIFQLQKSNNVVNVVVTSNDFGVALLANIRHNANIVPLGNDLQNGEHPYGGQCETNVRERDDEFECVALPVPDPNAFSPNYDINQLHPANVSKLGIVVPSWDDVGEDYAEEIFTVSTSWLSNAGLDVAIRMESIDNAVQSAQVHPKSDSVTSVLLAALQTLGLDTGAPLVVREKAVMGRVELLSRNERYDEAQFWLDTARAGMFAGYDSLNVDLLSARLAIMADTSLTLLQSADTLNALLTLETEHAKRPTGMNKELVRTMVRAGGGDVSFVVYPNPSRDHLTIRLEARPAGALTVRILDLIGTELYRLSRSSVTFGEEIVITDTDLPSGTYLVEVIDGTSSGAAVITVVR